VPPDAVQIAGRQHAPGAAERVDYWGISEALQEALSIFSPTDIEGALRPQVDELPRLQQRHRAALRFFDGVRDKADLDLCIAAIEPEDVRAELDVAFRRFAESMDRLLRTRVSEVMRGLREEAR